MTLIRKVWRRRNATRFNRVQSRDYGDVGRICYEPAADEDAGENKERAYLVKLYAAKVARGERLFEDGMAPPIEDRMNWHPVEAIR